MGGGILGWLQDRLETLHDVSTDLDVRAYIVDDDTRQQIPGAREGLPEQLFVREDDEGVELALYIEPGIMTDLERDHPERRLHVGNLEKYCVALEGVSHFVVVAWRAKQGRSVSALELEIQAEVDKFIGAWTLLAEQGHAMEATARPLIKRLFERYALRDDVEPEQSERYHTASSAARRYCQSLARRYGRTSDVRNVRADVRRYFRVPLSDKLRRAQ